MTTVDTAEVPETATPSGVSAEMRAAAADRAEMIWLTDIQSPVFTDAVEAIAARHSNPELKAMLGIDPDSPDALAASVLVAARPFVEAALTAALLDAAHVPGPSQIPVQVPEQRGGSPR